MFVHPAEMSARGLGPAFAGLLDEHLFAEERVVDSTDADLEVFDGHRMRTHHGLVVTLTNERLLGLRPRSEFGSRAPFEAVLTGINSVRVTPEVNVLIGFDDRYGTAGLWKLHVGGVASVAEHWVGLLARRGTLDPP